MFKLLQSLDFIERVHNKRLRVFNTYQNALQIFYSNFVK